ncbi:MAG: sensor histidine kinase [Polyangiaceae bacterium]
MRDEFLAIVGHDLGNPLNAIGLWARVLRNTTCTGTDGAEVSRMGSNIEREVRRMSFLLRDLGDVASIDSGRVSIRRQEGDAHALVADIVEAYAPLCADKQLSITSRAPVLPVSCDPNRVQQVLGNLVANAIKFTPSGGAITIEATPAGEEVRFSVADTGPGIPAEAREHIFERYWRGEQRDLTKGVGLGLYIAKGIVQGHGGRIWVESTVGHGSTFIFTLPATRRPLDS